MSRYVSLASKLLQLPAKLILRCRERGLLETCNWILYQGTSRYRRVLGVELSLELCEIARQQVRRAYNKLHCREEEIVQAEDALFPVRDEPNND